VSQQRYVKTETLRVRKQLTIAAGDADGLGEIRKKELVKSGLQLGLRDEKDIMVIEDT
jgi:N-acetylglucosaminylphosphatidylinositol deacetylase